jgi:hypothetical protein
VVQTLSEKGIKVTDEQVFLLAKVVASQPNPQLDILKIGTLNDRRSTKDSSAQSWFRVTCHEPGICVPFYAVVSWPGTLGASASAKNLLLKPVVAITMRVGAHATLVMDDNRSHIQIAVISLENGIAGHEIRVASADHKQVYVAEVVSAHLLKRSF